MDHHGGPGVQHIAFRVYNIAEIVKKLMERGVDFLNIPESYYDLLKKRIMETNFNEEICQKKELEIQLQKVTKRICFIFNKFRSEI